MPQPPSVSIFTRYLFENPWPLAVLFAGIAAVLAWHGAREGLWKRVQLAAVLLLGAVGVVATGSLVVTAGERGEEVTRRFVEAAVTNDLTGADRLLTRDATLAVGSPKNPGVNLSAIQSHLARLRNYQIAGNRITSLRGYGLERDRAQVHLACATESSGAYAGLVPSQWVLHVRREPDASWAIERITCISIAGRTPSLNIW